MINLKKKKKTDAPFEARVLKYWWALAKDKANAVCFLIPRVLGKSSERNTITFTNSGIKNISVKMGRTTCT